MKKDGSSCHFFHRPSMAYTTGTRKRRKIHANGREEVRWHKTGKTRPVLQVSLSPFQRSMQKMWFLLQQRNKHYSGFQTSLGDGVPNLFFFRLLLSEDRINLHLHFNRSYLRNLILSQEIEQILTERICN